MSKYFDILAYLMGKQAGGGGGGGGDITVEGKSIDANGTYTAPAGKAYSPVSVSVPNSYAAGDEGKVVSNGTLVAQGSDTVTQNGTVDTTLINSLLVNVSGGSGYGYTKLAEQDFTVNTSSTSETSVGTIAAGSAAANKNKIIYIRSRDKAGPRADHYYGTDTFYLKQGGNKSGFTYRHISGSLQSAANVYGIYASNINGSGDVAISSKYNSTFSNTIDGTYHVEVYTLDWPDGVSPFATS